MRITANQLTLARLVLLPVPVAMLYHGASLAGSERTAWLLGALLVYVLLGLTDAWDGMLARRYGSTPLGALLDPVVDKIFLVATYGPMLDLLIVPHVLVIALFIRELAITALRSLALEESFHFRTTRLAKLKTTVQMAGAGVALLIWLFPERRLILTLLGLIAFGGSVALLNQLVRGRMPTWRPFSSALMFCSVFALRLLLPVDRALDGVMWIIGALTVVSGLQYVWDMRGVLAARFGRLPIDLARVLLLSTVLPIVFLGLMVQLAAWSLVIMATLSLELAVGGLDNFLIQAGHRRGPGWDLARSLVQLLAGLGMFWAAGEGGRPQWILPFALAALTVTAVDFAVRLIRHREVLLDPRAV